MGIINLNPGEIIFLKFDKAHWEYWFYATGSTYEFLQNRYNSEYERITGNILYLPKSSRIGVEVICDNNFKRIFADDIKIEREFKYVILEKMRQLYKEVIPLSNEY